MAKEYYNTAYIIGDNDFFKQWILEELTLPIIILIQLCAPTLMFQV
ncbi:unnamed protein product [Brassica oleracea var. botrytis]